MNDGDDDDDVENVVFLRRPVIVSQPEHLVVDNGMTISLPCIVDQIPGGKWFPLGPFYTQTVFHSARFFLSRFSLGLFFTCNFSFTLTWPERCVITFSICQFPCLGIFSWPTLTSGCPKYQLLSPFKLLSLVFQIIYLVCQEHFYLLSTSFVIVTNY